MCPAGMAAVLRCFRAGADLLGPRVKPRRSADQTGALIPARRLVFPGHERLAIKTGNREDLSCA
jgi:hypothetical protein